MGITFEMIRRYISRVDKISVCMFETKQYENYNAISEVPHDIDGRYLYGIGMIESGFSQVDGVTEYAPCLEIVLAENLQCCEQEILRQAENLNRKLDYEEGLLDYKQTAETVLVHAGDHGSAGVL